MKFNYHMFFSKKFNLLFIASPKTGTVSVHELLQQIDSEGQRRKVEIDDGTEITSRDIRGGVIGHANALDLKKAIGEKRWSELETIILVRHPMSKLVSSYFFNKNQPLLSVFNMKGGNKRNLRIIKSFSSRLSAKILPFWLFIILFPMKTNLSYCTGSKGERIVKHIGRTENLTEDLSVIFKRIGIDADIKNRISHLNKTKHKSADYYFSKRIVRYFFNLRYKADLTFYNEIVEEYE